MDEFKRRRGRIWGGKGKKEQGGRRRREAAEEHKRNEEDQWERGIRGESRGVM